jgi:hypothetical protein
MAAALLWNEERLSVVRNLLVDEGLTRAAIADRVGVSKSSVIHAVQKYGLVGLSQRRDIAKAAGLQRRIGNGGVFRAHAMQTSLPARCARNLPIESSPRAVTFAQYDPCANCAWPIGDDLFCGRGKIPKSSYCIRHHRRAYPEKCS